MAKIFLLRNDSLVLSAKIVQYGWSVASIRAHSGKSVTPDDETNISDRLGQFKANGFIGFYSTLASSGLNARLDSYNDRYKIQIFDKEKIEAFILNHKRYELFRRYFPVSYKAWLETEIRPQKYWQYINLLIVLYVDKIYWIPSTQIMVSSVL